MTYRWMNNLHCPKCGLRGEAKPTLDCTLPRHWQTWNRVKSRNTAYHRKNRESVLAKYRARNAQIRYEVLTYYCNMGSPHCACCGEKNLVFLTLDHINEDGAKHRREIFGGSGRSGNFIYGWILKNNFPQGFQVLCWNCNYAKHRLGKCPHQVLKVKYQ